jgi:hypothetical protein
VTIRIVEASLNAVKPFTNGEKHAWKQIPTGWLCMTYTEEGSVTVRSTVTIRRRGPEEA